MNKQTLHIFFSRPLIAALSLLCILFSATTSNYTTVSAATPVKAEFYLVDESKILSLYPNVTPQNSKSIRIGVGSINYTKPIYYNSSAVKKIIVESPKNANYNWCHAVYFNGTYYVGASLSTANYNNSIPNNTNNTNGNINASEPTIHSLTRDEILSLKSSAYPSTDIVVWDKYRIGKNDLCDGKIPMSLINDPVYTSMNLPSETRSQFMIDGWLDNGHIMGNTSSSQATHMLPIGSLYQTANVNLPSHMKLSLGKIKTFGYNKYTQKWEIITSDPYPKTARIYTLPWESAQIYDVQTTKYNDHITVHLTADDLTGNCLHFWGSRVAFDKSKYLYYATAYTYWAEGSYFKEGSITAVNGIDLKTASGTKTVNQLCASRGMSMTYTHKTIWSTTIPNSVYKSEWGNELQALFNQ